MCYICCSFDEPPLSVGAVYRLSAATADEARARFILEHLGFMGLTMRSNGGGIIKFKYTSYDERRLNHMMGAPESRPDEPYSRYPYGQSGRLAVWPAKSEVLLRNVRSKSPSIEMPDVLEKEGPPPIAELPKAGTENDDAGVPVTWIPDNLSRDYVRSQTVARYRLKFMQDLWDYFNVHKFAHALKRPGLKLMPARSAAGMRIRGFWDSGRYELHMNPNIFNASQNFFLEVFLHEMCHQAVTDHWWQLTEAERADNAKHKGHGTAWSAWMRKVGLNPLRFDPNENSTYMAQDEKEAHDAKQAKWKESKDAAEALGLNLVTKLSVGQLVYVRRLDGLRKGVAIKQVKKTPNTWAIAPWSLVESGLPDGQYSWWLSDIRTVYANDGNIVPTHDEFYNIGKIVNNILAYYKRVAEVKKQQREARRRAREVDY